MRKKFDECAKSNQKSCLFEHNLVSNGISCSRFDYATIWPKRNNLVYFNPSVNDDFLEFTLYISFNAKISRDLVIGSMSTVMGVSHGSGTNGRGNSCLSIVAKVESKVDGPWGFERLFNKLWFKFCSLCSMTFCIGFKDRQFLLMWITVRVDSKSSILRTIHFHSTHFRPDSVGIRL